MPVFDDLDENCCDFGNWPITKLRIHWQWLNVSRLIDNAIEMPFCKGHTDQTY